MTFRPVTVPSPAKINLFLEVLGRRADGYHTLSTLFQEITLADTLRAVPTRTPGYRLTCSPPGLTTGPDNLVLRAARLFPARPGLPPGVRFALTKRIPVGAGLGGGSGNAAAALKALWRLAEGRAPFPEKAFRSSARALGADVPFFLRGGFAEGRGVGERLSFPVLRRRTPVPFVLVFPRVFSATPEAYRRLSFPLTKRRSGLRLKRAIAEGAPPRLWASWLFNRLEETVLARFPAVAEARRALLRAGCLAALMSGSGSSVFGVVETPAEGRRVLARLRGDPWDSWLVFSAGPPGG